MQTKQKKTNPRSRDAIGTTSRRHTLGLLASAGASALLGCSQTGQGGALGALGFGSAGAGGGAGTGEANAGGSGATAQVGGAASTERGTAAVAGSSARDAAANPGAGGAAGVDAGATTADVGSGGRASSADDLDSDAGTPPDAELPCMLTAEQEEGPFYVPVQQIRSDITDGKQGLPLELTLTLVDVTTCKPLANAAVDVWHCDYTGLYSGEASQGTSGQGFHRGIQITNASGQATFQTFYPGWYNGRTVHVHIKVHVGGMPSGASFSGGHVSHTGNVFFPQATNDAVAGVSPYQGGDKNNRTLNANDMVWRRQNGEKSVCSVSGSETSALTASIVLGIDPTATPQLIGIHS